MTGAELYAAIQGDLDKRRALLARVLTVRVLPAPNGRPPGWKPGTPYFHPDYVEVTRKL
jgi:site-specific DNA recombinase